MELGFCWAFPADCTPEAGLPRLRDYGFDGVELWPQAIDQYGVERWATALKVSGLKCLQLCPYFNFVAGEQKMEASRAMLDRYLQAASLLGCQRLRVFTGPPWGEGVVGAEDASEKQWQAATDGLREFCLKSSAQGVELCLECHEGSLMENGRSALRLLRAVNHSNLSTNLQLPLLKEDWQASLELLGSYTTHIHIHNWTHGLGQGELTFLGEGVFDWMPVLSTLLGRFQKSLCVSVEHPDHSGRHDPWETARRDGETLTEWRGQLGLKNNIL